MNNILEEYKNTNFNYDNFIVPSDEINISFNRFPKVEIIGKNNDDDTPYEVKFLDNKTGRIYCRNFIKKNHWIGANQKFFVDWRIIVSKGDKVFVDYILNLENQNVLIVFDSKSLGDNICWVPQVEKFRKKHKCNLYVSTFFNHLFEESYPEINFVEPNKPVENIKFDFEWWLGVYMEQIEFYHPTDWRLVPLGQIGSDQLGLDYEEIKCKIDKPKNHNLSFIPNKKYVCISMASTAGLKHWQNPEGWQKTVDYLKSLGYEVILIQRERLPWMDLKPLDGILHPNLDNFDDVVNLVQNCEFFIGLSSGISWLAWALEKKVILISGFTKPWLEFYTPHRIINENVCNGCWHDLEYKFDRGDWNWCPRKQDFECSKAISAEKVIQEINKIV